MKIVPNITMSTKLSHFLDEQGEVTARLNTRGRNLVGFFGAIIRATSSTRTLTLEEEIRCRRRIGGKRCTGTILAYCKLANLEAPITWFCEECAEGGLIYDWQGSPFDNSSLHKQSVQEHERAGLWINGRRLDEIGLLLDSGGSGKCQRVFSARQMQAQSTGDGELCLKLPAMLALELYRSRVIAANDEPVVVRVGDNAPLEYRLREVIYSTCGEDTVTFLFQAIAPGALGMQRR